MSPWMICFRPLLQLAIHPSPRWSRTYTRPLEGSEWLLAAEQTKQPDVATEDKKSHLYESDEFQRSVLLQGAHTEGTRHPRVPTSATFRCETAALTLFVHVYAAVINNRAISFSLRSICIKIRYEPSFCLVSWACLCDFLSTTATSLITIYVNNDSNLSSSISLTLLPSHTLNPSTLPTIAHLQRL